MKENEFEKIKTNKEIKESEKIFDNYTYNSLIKFVNNEISIEQIKNIMDARIPMGALIKDEEYEKSKSIYQFIGTFDRLLKEPTKMHRRNMSVEMIIEQIKGELVGKKILEIGPAGSGGAIKVIKDLFKDDVDVTAVEKSHIMNFAHEKGIDTYEKCDDVFEESNIDLVVLEDYDYDKKIIEEILKKKGPFDIIVCRRVFYDGDGNSIDSNSLEANEWFEFYNLFLKKGGMAVYDSPEKYNCIKVAKKFTIRVEEFDQEYELAGFGDVFIKY